MSGRARVGVLISGRGSNLQALIDASAAADYPAEIALVVSNVAGAGGLARAEAAGIATAVLPHGDHAGREGFEAAIDAALRAAEVEIVCLAGFMRILTGGFVARWPGRILNVHPSLLPAFPGLDTHARALAAGCKLAGCSVHVVTAELDAGPILAQAAVAVRADDTADSLAARVLEQEHILYPRALAHLAAGRVRLEAGRAIVDAPAPRAALANPESGSGTGAG